MQLIIHDCIYFTNCNMTDKDTKHHWKAVLLNISHGLVYDKQGHRWLTAQRWQVVVMTQLQRKNNTPKYSNV